MKPVNSLRELTEKINILGTVKYDEPLANYTTYRVGGPADVFVEPADPHDIVAVLAVARAENFPVFILGEGANILVSDRGIRGFVVHMPALAGVTIVGTSVECQAGSSISEVSWTAASAGLEGLAFIFSMPGSAGGALWMNARCYGSSISAVLQWVEVIDQELNIVRLEPSKNDFDYKASPFQHSKDVILRASFRLQQGDKEKIFREMETNRADREKKGHFIAPSAGSVFRNNRDFGDPTGKIIDRLGLRGYTHGGAKISDHHANMIINTGGATATDIENLIQVIAKRVREELGLNLDREVIPVGDWDQDSL
jgi:UDP-N-acetylmuramate dehydrogenase